MKKITLLILTLIIWTFQAQNISDYYFEEENLASYNNLAGATIALSGDSDDGDVENIPIGFSFNYAGTSYTEVTIDVNGGISFTETSVSFSNDLASTSDFKKNIIAPLWDDLYLRSADNGKVEYKTIGTAPLRQFVVEWENVSWRNTGKTVTFSLTLYETYNMIEFRYGPNNSDDTRSASIGINDGSGNFISVTPGNPATTSTTTANNNISTADYPYLKLYRFTPTPPVNDWFSNGIVLPNLDNLWMNLYAFNVGATDSGGDDPDCGLFNGGDVWYKITAPQRGIVAIKRTSIGGWGFMGYAIYLANNYSGQEITCDFIRGSEVDEERYIYLEPGEQYSLRVWEYNNNSFGTVQFALKAIDNDFNTSAPLVKVQSVNNTSFEMVYANNTGATQSPGTPSCTFVEFNGGDVWYKFIAPSSGNVSLFIPEVTDWSSISSVLYHNSYSGTEVGCGVIYNTFQSSNVPAEHVYSGLTPGDTYYIRMFDFGNNDFGVTKFYLVDNSVLGVEDYEALNFKYYPNPTTDFMNITSENTITKIEVMNITGQQVIQMMPQRQKAQINLSNLPKGIYLMKVNTGDNSKIVKIVKK